MNDAKTRVFEERKELTSKIDKLALFIRANEAFNRLSKKMRRLLKRQLRVMKRYFNILTKRLRVWEDK